MGEALSEITAEVVDCRHCPRLVAWREGIAADPPKRHRGETYWARPLPGFGDPEARIVVVGLAPAANGANRTGRMFTGDRSGDWLFAAMHRAGLANQPESVNADDGLELIDAWVTAVNRCAPPDNKPTIEERDNCLPFLERELVALMTARVIVTLGAYGWAGAFRALGTVGAEIPKPKPKFGHGAEVVISGSPHGDLTMIGCFHPSQQNTFTGRLTEPMIDAVFARAAKLAAA